MAQINPYLTFGGNCRQAMNFYKDILGGKLTLQTIGESPMAIKMPADMKNYILHARLACDDLVLMGSDMVSEQGLLQGNTVSLMLDCNSEASIKKFYQQLAEGGTATHPLADTFWGAVFGDLTDKFGNHWLLNFDKNQSL
jgi:PhnB protein